MGVGVDDGSSDLHVLGDTCKQVQSPGCVLGMGDGGNALCFCALQSSQIVLRCLQGAGVWLSQGAASPAARLPALLPSSCQFCLGTKNSRVESCPSGQGWWAALQGTLASLPSSLTATPCCPALPGLARVPMSSCRRLSQGQDGRCLALPCPQWVLDT